MADYSILEQVKIRLRQFHVEDDDTVVFDKKEEDPLLNQLIEYACGNHSAVNNSRNDLYFFLIPLRSDFPQFPLPLSCWQPKKNQTVP